MSITRFVQHVALLALVGAALLTGDCALAAQPLNIGSLQGLLSLDGHIDVLEDPDQSLSLDDVRAPANADRFVTLAGSSATFGFSPSAYWVRLALDNNSDESTTALLRQDYPLIDDLELWREDERGAWEVVETGDRRVFSSREIDHQQFIFRLSVPARSSRTVYLRYASGGSMNIGLSISDDTTLVGVLSREQLGYGIYFGGFIALLLYNLFLFIAVRDRAFFYYLLYLASYGTYFAIHNGLTFQFLWPDSPWWGNKSLVVLLSLSLFWGLAFSRNILSSERTSPRLDRVAAAIQWAAALGLLGAIILPYAQIVLVLALMSVLAPPVLIAMGAAGLFAGHRAARYFLLAWSTLLVGVIVYMLKTFGFLPHNFITQNGFQIGSLIEMALLSLALASRVNELQRDSVTDPLTGLFNRRSFDESLREEYARSGRYGQPLSLMLIDVDHFKTYNDNYGHQFGDDALRSVARVLRKSVRKTDRLCRYGGEEFVILMPATNAKEARVLAERQRELVDNHRLPRGALTISVGIATLMHESFESAAELVRAADDALYAAKKAGRNRVEIYTDQSVDSPKTTAPLAAGT